MSLAICAFTLVLSAQAGESAAAEEVGPLLVEVELGVVRGVTRAFLLLLGDGAITAGVTVAAVLVAEEEGVLLLLLLGDGEELEALVEVGVGVGVLLPGEEEGTLLLLVGVEATGAGEEEEPLVALVVGALPSWKEGYMKPGMEVEVPELLMLVPALLVGEETADAEEALLLLTPVLRGREAELLMPLAPVLRGTEAELWMLVAPLLNGREAVLLMALAALLSGTDTAGEEEEPLTEVPALLVGRTLLPPVAPLELEMGADESDEDDGPLERDDADGWPSDDEGVRAPVPLIEVGTLLLGVVDAFEEPVDEERPDDDALCPGVGVNVGETAPVPGGPARFMTGASSTGRPNVRAAAAITSKRTDVDFILDGDCGLMFPRKRLELSCDLAVVCSLVEGQPWRSYIPHVCTQH